ncbi:hypothetical protein ASF34_00950 [Methylobacterium sp. Leaf106]|nr:hypothetical protein ASF34_00950 [Methylobacterium sp. Leaf106]
MADETCVYAEPQTSMPEIGDDIWWQAGAIYFDGDQQHLKKVGYSFSPSPAQASGSRKTESDHA